MTKKLKKEIREWIILIGILLILIYTPLGTKITSTLQRGILATGLIKPRLETDESEAQQADYEFTISDRDGNRIDFTNYKGKTIFLNFWATWCGPCIAEMPDINELHNSYKDNDSIEFIMIAVDDDFQKALDYVDEKEYSLPIFKLKTSLPSVYSASTIPTTYVISPRGKIVVERHGIAKYNSESFKEFIRNLNSDLEGV
ncbi:MAG: TlpA family protein disulfide reductase [bacterium]|nr:TlpA family protein disulfide reductase [bacterium]